MDISSIRHITGLVFLFILAFTVPGEANPLGAPVPDPPVAIYQPQPVPVRKAAPTKSPPVTEWLYHKTNDNLHPSGIEQEMLWLMNRARMNPPHEGVWLANTDDSQVQGAMAFFNVDRSVLTEEFSIIDAKPPSAFDARLYAAAKAHSDDLIVRNAQDHNNQFERITDAGFSYRSARGNVYSTTLSGLYGHAGFNVDWGGSDGTGMQTGRGHRLAIMSMDGNYTNAGIAVVSETDTSTTRVGPYVTTGNYCYANESAQDHFNRFIVGTVWEDTNGNGLYDPGEGSGGITVTPDAGTYYAVTATSGGYAIPVDSGTYQVTFSGPGLNDDVVRSAVVASDSILLDLGPPYAMTGPAETVASTSAVVSGTVLPNGFTTTYRIDYGTTIDLGSLSTDIVTDTGGDVSISIANLEPESTYYYKIVADNSAGTSEGEPALFTTPASDNGSGEDPPPDDTGDQDTDAPVPLQPATEGDSGGCFIGSL